jgi:hypothetical protein
LRRPFGMGVIAILADMTIAKPRAWLVSAGWGLAILTLINLFNYLDRYVVTVTSSPPCSKA